MKHTPHLSALLLPLLLGACSQGTPQPPLASGPLVHLTLHSPVSRAVAAQGLPGTAGHSPVDHLKVKVYDAQHHAVTFDGQNVYRQGGMQLSLTLDADHPSVDVLLPQGTYSFENIGTASADGAFMAYGWNEDQNLGALGSSVNLELHSLLDPETLSLNTYLPTSYAFTQDVLDLRLKVLTPTSGGVGLPVPLGDYSVAYAAPLGEVLGSSQLGARVKVIGQTDAPGIDTTATVTGWVADGPDTASRRSVPVTRRIALGLSSIGADVGRPNATLSPLDSATVGQSVVLTGDASDVESGVGAVRVFDGSTLIGSTDEADGVPLVTFALTATLDTGTDWSLVWTPTTAGERDLTLVVDDIHGNETWLQQSVAVAAEYR
ncbi:Ig-like domain-containing protein [Deinococcus sp.]|uniref:Ig-like domain-containing protein n=1 Tax=Deinococcus sp. TaxID=47478 RepID=UPI0028698F58|nr:Ig-like domain-containing protein [Deinococcus sp.]